MKMSFASQSLDEAGELYGQSKESGNLVLSVRQAPRRAPWACVCGKPGSGKSFFGEPQVLTRIAHPARS